MSNIIMNNYRQKRLKVSCTYRVTVAKLPNMFHPWCYLLWKKNDLSWLNAMFQMSAMILHTFSSTD